MAPKKKPEPRLTRPKRLTLVDQVVECLRAELSKGVWQELLPTEGELCKDLGVSRGTLRRALTVLFDEGLLASGGRGERHKICGRSRATRSTNNSSSGQFVRILSPQPRFILGGQTQMVFQTVNEVIGRAGLHLEFDYHPGLWELKRPASRLKRLTDHPDTAGWLLYRSTRPIQDWFSDSDIPTVALGAVYPGVTLPHAEFDLPAACRHAVGVLSSRGRRNLVFLMVTNATAGDLECVDAFAAACDQLGLSHTCVEYDDTVEGLCRSIDSLLVTSPPPDGYLVGFANHVPATIGHLRRRGCPVPEDASVISRMDARLLVESIPSIARYEADAEMLGRCIGRLFLQVIDSNKGGVPRSHVIMPEFVDGESAACQNAK